MFGAESHLHTEMKTQWTVSLEKKTVGERAGAEKRSGGITSGECCAGERVIFFFLDGSEEKYQLDRDALLPEAGS